MAQEDEVTPEDRLVELAAECANFAVDHMLTSMEARVRISGRQFTVKVDNGESIWDDGPFPRTETEEFRL